jgi:tRNA nucleotidyltransferase (CCA-adding enzyme)
MRRLLVGEVLRALPPAAQSLVESIVEAARARGVELYLVGGPVRDLLLGREIRDVDLLIDARAGVSAEALARAAAPEGAKVTEHDRFATAVLATPEAAVDLVTARSESYARPGVLPRVELGSLQDDMRRRDFSVNALAIPLTGDRFSPEAEIEVIDLEEGLRDLEEKRLRVLHAKSFHDDPTRALRAARLAPRLAFNLSRGSRSLLRDALRDGVFGAVSGDRLRREMEKLFADARLGLDPAAALRKLRDWHVMAALEPGLDLPREAVAPLRRLGRAIAAPPWRGPRLRVLASGLSVWLAPLSPSLRRRTAARFSLRGDSGKRLVAFPAARDAWLKSLAEVRGRGGVDQILGEIDEESLYALYAWAPPPIRKRILRWAAEDRARRSPVSGTDLVAIGISGPAIGRALARIRAAFLDGAVANREEAVALARELERPRSRRTAGGRRGMRSRSPDHE